MVNDNTAIGNDTGITTAGIDGGGNKAAGNITNQCTGVACASP